MSVEEPGAAMPGLAPMSKRLRFLVVDDRDDDYQRLLLALRHAGYEVSSERVHDANGLAAALTRSWDLIATDWLLPGLAGLQVLDALAERGIDTPCIVISGTPDEEAAVAALRAGALDFVSKHKPLRHVPAIERALRDAGVRRAPHAAERAPRERRHATEEASRLESSFLANMSHELRTPLNAIIGFAELLHDGHVEPASPQHREFLGDILASGRHLLELIDGVLDFAKLEAGELAFYPEDISLREVIDDVVANIRTRAAAKAITVQCEIDPEVDRASLDPDRLRQIAYNFVSNALAHTDHGGRVVIRAVGDGDAAFRIEVADTGVGIAPADLGRLFVAFQQLDGGTGKRHQGIGLGLALTRRLVEAQGGRVGVRSEVGHGSVFYATLPRRSEHGITMSPVGAQRRAARVEPGSR